MASKFLEFNLSPLNNPFSFSDQCNFNLFFSSTSLFWSCQSRILLSSNNIISQNSTSWIFTNEIWNFICTWKNSTIEFTISCYMVLLLLIDKNIEIGLMKSLILQKTYWSCLFYSIIGSIDLGKVKKVFYFRCYIFLKNAGTIYLITFWVGWLNSIGTWKIQLFLWVSLPLFNRVVKY